jgi:hypothetical protein
MSRPVSNLVKLKGRDEPCLIDIDEVEPGLKAGLVEYVLDEATGERLEDPFSENPPKEEEGDGDTPEGDNAAQEADDQAGEQGEVHEEGQGVRNVSAGLRGEST